MRSGNAGADLTGWPSAVLASSGPLVSWMTDLKRLKLSAVGDWNRRTTASSRAVFSNALRVCLASLSCPGPPDLAEPLTSALPASYAAVPGRPCADAMKVPSIADGDTVS